MKKQNIIQRTFIISFILIIPLLLVAGCAFGRKHAVNSLDNFRDSVAEQFGTAKVVYFRERENYDPLYYGEPFGAYVYTGYVGYGMTDWDVKSLDILATGSEAEHLVGTYEKLDRNIQLWNFALVVGVFIALSVYITMPGSVWGKD